VVVAWAAAGSQAAATMSGIVKRFTDVPPAVLAG